jgi:putative oxidoreductase
VQRPYSKFPGNWPGLGLLLLRAALGLTLIVQGSIYVAAVQDAGVEVFAACALAIVSGGALVVGFLTPVACPLAIVGGFSIVLLSPTAGAWNFFNGTPLIFDLLIMALASALLGPGAFSLDAHLFGRRKIVIPRSSHSQSSSSSASNPGISADLRSTSSSSRPPQS